jgi:hypothetical protein
MIMAWPVKKWLALATMIDEFLAHNPCIFSPFECSSLLGLIRNAAPVAPLGVFYSLWIQHALNEGVQAVWRWNQSPCCRLWRCWYHETGIIVPLPTTLDLHLLQSTLDDIESHPVWSRYIGLLVDQEPMHECFSDASNAGI